MATICFKFPKLDVLYFLDTLGAENFIEIALSLTGKEIEAILLFAIFGKNSNFDEIALSQTVQEIEAICFLPFLTKIQNGRYFWKIFQKWV